MGQRPGFERACRKAKVADFRFHGLRHTCASWLALTCQISAAYSANVITGQAWNVDGGP